MGPMFNGMLTEERRSSKSLLSGVQRGWLAVALVLAGLLLANTLYLLANRLASAVLPGVTAERVAEGTYTVSKLFQVTGRRWCPSEGRCSASVTRPCPRRREWRGPRGRTPVRGRRRGI